MSKENHTYHPRLRAGVTRQHRGACLHAFASGYVCDKGEGSDFQDILWEDIPAGLSARGMI